MATFLKTDTLAMVISTIVLEEAPVSMATPVAVYKY